MKKTNLLLILIIIFFLITRTYKINTIPPSLYWDEASIGYNAYSILKTGHDEWGKFLPLHFRAFGEFKLPVYIYTVAFFESIFGLNELAVRIPSVLFSLGTIFLTFLLAAKISKNLFIGIYSSFILAIMPWFFLFSRVGYEASAGLMFYLLGIYLYLLGIDKYFYLFFSMFSFILSIYSYNSFRIIVPLTLIFLFVYLIRIWKEKTSMLAIIIIINGLILLTSMIPIARLYILDNGLARLRAVGSSANLIEKYFSHFSPDFLFIKGDKNLRIANPGFGQLNFLQLPFLFLGLIFIYKSRNPLLYLCLVVIALSPIPAAITKESPHALRSVCAAPFYSILTACGIFFITQNIKKHYLIHPLIIASFLGLFFYYFYNFNVFYSVKASQEWQFGYKKIFIDYKNEFDKYQRIIISDYLAQPYIFLLYYLQYPPDKLKTGVSYNPYDKWGFSTVKTIDKFTFGKIVEKDIIKGKYLIFTSSKERLEDVKEKNIILDLEGNVAFYVYEINK